MDPKEHINLLVDVAYERTRKADRIQTIYENWLENRDDGLFIELTNHLDQYCIFWIRRQLWKSNCYTKDNEDTILQEGRLAIWEYMHKEKVKETVEKFVGFSFCVYRNKTLDLINDIYRKRKQEAFSINDPMDDEEKIERGCIMESKEIPDLVIEEEKRTMYKKMFYLYCSSFMESTAFPPRILALYYARILPHLLSIEWGEKTIPDTKATSAKWAFDRMGQSTVDELRLDSELMIQSAISKKLRWSDAFIRQLNEEVLIYGRRDILKNIVYTAVYDKGKIEDWADYMHKATIKACIRNVSNEPGLLELIREYISKRDVLYCFIGGK